MSSGGDAKTDKPTDKKPADPKAAERKAAVPVAKPPGKPAPKDDASERLPVPPPWWKTLRAEPPTYIRFALGAGLIVLMLLGWWFVTRGEAVERIISPSKLPSPGEVSKGFGMLIKLDVTDHLLSTLERVFKGIFLAALVGISVGVFAASNRGVNAAVAPLVIFLRSVPMGALIPLTLLLFGTGESQKALFIFLAVVPFVFSDTVKAISIVPDRYIETAQTLGATNWQVIRKVLVPLALPDVITSLRFQMGLALGYITLAEAGNIIVDSGVGKLIEVSQKRALPEQVYMLLFVIALVAFTLDLVIRTIQRGVFPWRRDL